MYTFTSQASGPFPWHLLETSVMPNTGFSAPRIFAWGSAVLGVCLTSTAVYRRYFHPLAGVPGPLLAAVTRLYALYFNVVKDGSFYLEIERLHSIYGTGGSRPQPATLCDDHLGCGSGSDARA